MRNSAKYTKQLDMSTAFDLFRTTLRVIAYNLIRVHVYQFLFFQTNIKFLRDGNKRRIKSAINFYKYVNYTKRGSDEFVIPTLVARIGDDGIETERLQKKWG